jgi:MoaA/NifB/PqqE/SkfB family radical SAM enzyme
MSWSPEFFNPSVPDWCRDECSYYVTWAFGNKCKYGCPYCYVEKSKYKYRPREHSEKKIIQAWDNMFDEYGPVFMSLSGMEPGDDLFLLSRILNLGHYACLTTNFSMSIDDMLELIPQRKVVIHPTFHPHKDDFSQFLMKVLMFKTAGYRVPVVAIVGYPPIVHKIDEWVATLGLYEISVNVVPMRFVEYDGKPMPEGYTQEQREIIGRHCGGVVFDDQAQVRRLNIRACAAGHATATIAMDGTVLRCGEDIPIGGNLFEDGIIKFMDEPKGCNMEFCQCGNLVAYHIEVD